MVFANLQGEEYGFQIDHIVISPHGIFVIETKNWNCFFDWIDLAAVEWLSDSGYVHSLVVQNRGHIRKLQNLLTDFGVILETENFISLVVFAKSTYNKPNFDEKVDGVVHSDELVREILSHGDVVFQPDEWENLDVFLKL